MEKEMVLITSRKGYIENYILAVIIFAGSLYLDVNYELPISLFLVGLIPICYLLLEPEYEVFVSKWKITNEGVSEEKGILNKTHQSIPWQLTAYTTMDQSFLGRIFEFGTIVITSAAGEKNTIIMKKISNPKNVLTFIEKKMKKAMPIK